MLRRGVLVTVVLLALAPAPARAQDATPWATVNVCDTLRQRSTIGIRGSMPGLGDRRVRMRMRFLVEFRGPGRRWARVPRGADSGWQPVGSGALRTRQSGWSFRFRPPSAGGAALVLRGLVSFEWRRGTRLLRRARARTTAGRADVRGGDPPGTSLAVCTLRPAGTDGA